MNQVDVAVAVAEDARERLYEIAAACRALGLQHTATLPVIGVLVGSMESGELPRLWAVPGVLAVEVKRDYRRAVIAKIRRHPGRAN
jgi:hypothetical protein